MYSSFRTYHKPHAEPYQEVPRAVPCRAGCSMGAKLLANLMLNTIPAWRLKVTTYLTEDAPECGKESRRFLRLKML